MLRLESLSCGYGEMTVVHGLTLNVTDAEISALLGANGAGKSSTIMCIAGHVAGYWSPGIVERPQCVRFVGRGQRLFAGGARLVFGIESRMSGTDHNRLGELPAQGSPGVQPDDRLLAEQAFGMPRELAAEIAPAAFHGAGNFIHLDAQSLCRFDYGF